MAAKAAWILTTISLFATIMVALAVALPLTLGSSSEVTLQDDPIVKYKDLPVYFADKLKLLINETMENFEAQSGRAPFSVDPALPVGISLNVDTGEISGTPLVVANGVFRVSTSDDRQFDLSIEVYESTSGEAPAIAYDTPVNVRDGDTVNVRPLLLNSHPPTSWSILTPLVSGLNFDTSTGEITGTVSQTFSNTYQITGTNAFGSSSPFSLTISATHNTPVVSYPGSSFVDATFNTPIASLTPTLQSGSAATQYVISPPLPSGILFDAGTGAISGTPTETSGRTKYEILARNAAGDGNISTLYIKVSNVPTQLSYSIGTVQAGNAINVTPTVTGPSPVEVSVYPALPTGLTLNSATGVISGTPAQTPEHTYEVTCMSETGSTSTSVTFAVQGARITTVITGLTTLTAYVGEAIAPVSPVVESTSTGYWIQPELPAGLSMDSLTGTISGTPTAHMPETSYQLYTGNSEGEGVPFNFDIHILPDPMADFKADVTAKRGLVTKDCASSHIPPYHLDSIERYVIHSEMSAIYLHMRLVMDSENKFWCYGNADLNRATDTPIIDVVPNRRRESKMVSDQTSAYVGAREIISGNPAMWTSEMGLSTPAELVERLEDYNVLFIFHLLNTTDLTAVNRMNAFETQVVDAMSLDSRRFILMSDHYDDMVIGASKNWHLMHYHAGSNHDLANFTTLSSVGEKYLVGATASTMQATGLPFGTVTTYAWNQAGSSSYADFVNTLASNNNLAFAFFVNPVQAFHEREGTLSSDANQAQNVRGGHGFGSLHMSANAYTMEVRRGVEYVEFDTTDVFSAFSSKSNYVTGPGSRIVNLTSGTRKAYLEGKIKFTGGTGVFNMRTLVNHPYYVSESTTLDHFDIRVEYDGTNATVNLIQSRNNAETPGTSSTFALALNEDLYFSVNFTTSGTTSARCRADKSAFNESASPALYNSTEAVHADFDPDRAGANWYVCYATLKDPAKSFTDLKYEVEYYGNGPFPS